MAKKGAPKTKKSTPAAVAARPRQLKMPRYSSFRLNKRIKTPSPKLTGSFRLFGRSLQHVWKHRVLYGKITALYFILTLLLVRGFGSTARLTDVKAVLQEVFDGGAAGLQTSLTLFDVLLGSSTTASSDVASAYQSILLVLVSLMVIWSLRQTYAEKKISLRDALYKSMHPLVPFLLVLLVIGLQLLPLLLGSYLFSLAFYEGIAVTALEQVVWFVLTLLLVVLSAYMVTSSIFALYIVTLPDIRPMQALRSARELVRFRRWEIIRRVILFPLIISVIGLVLMLPIILILTPVAEWIFLALSLLALVVMHSYLYALYRELI